MAMLEQGGHQQFPLPLVAEALKPFIKTREEALRIRRVLSLYIASQIEGLPNGNPSPISLAAPEEQVRVKEIPTQITGLRRDYLLALQANVAAKEVYARVAEELEDKTSGKSRTGTAQGENDSWSKTSTYMDLFEARQKHTKLKILQDYTDLLAKKDAAQTSYLTLESIVNELGNAPDLASVGEDDGSDRNSNGEATQAYIFQLEKALLRVNSSLQRERKLLAEAKEKYQNLAPDTSKAPTRSARNHALSRSRDELVAWVEEQLSKIKETEDASEHQAQHEPTKNISSIENQKVAIQKLYKDYLDLRETLVALASKPRSVPTVETLKVEGAKKGETTEQSPPKADLEAATILPFITEHLIPAADSRLALFQQDSYIAKARTDQSKTTERMLDRLADESHLLATFPLLAAQPRFKKTAAALGGPKLQSSPFADTEDSQEESRVVQRGRTWAFAADAAKTAHDDALERKLQHGEEHAQAARASLCELQNLLNGSVDADEDREEDIWVEQTKGDVSKRKRSLWRGLDGRIGVDSKKP